MNEEMKIKTGDVVTLKSGGPMMTVGQVGPADGEDDDFACAEDECACAWFDGHKVRWNDFKVDMLKKVEASELRAAADAVYTSLIDHGEVEPHKVTLLGRALAKEVS